MNYLTTKVVIQNTESKSKSKKRNKYIPSIEKAKLKLNLEVNTSLESSLQKMIDFNRGLL
jgi:hypothetical protein